MAATKVTLPFRTRTALCLGTMAACGCLALPGRAHAASEGGAAELSFAQLTSMEVTGVSKSAERTLDAPAAVTVINGDEIRAFGFRTLGEVLNTAPGYFSYSDLSFGYAGVRGFAPIGASNSRVLLLIDGFPSNDNFFEQALLGNEAIIDLALVDRIEIIRGPSSSVYGSNAFLGVINVILKGPAQLTSGAQAWAGSAGERGLSGTLSAGVGDNVRYLLRLTESAANGQDVTYDPQNGLPAGARLQGVDANDVARAFAKLIDGNLRVNLGFSARRQQAGYGLHGDVLGDPRSFVRDGTSFADLHYEGSLDPATDYVLRASAAEYRYDAQIVDDPTNPNFLPAVGDWIDTEATATHHFSARNRLVVGVELRRDLREDMTQASAAQGAFLQIHNSSNRFGLYAQSDVDWSDHWSSSVGLRDDINNADHNINPRLALMWKPSSDQSLKLMAGSAFRQASAFERFFAQPPSFLVNPGLTPERVRTLDLEYEAQLHADTHMSVTLFQYRALDLIEQVLLDPNTGATQFQNEATAKAHGVDLSLEQQLFETTRLRLSASYADAYDVDAGAWLQNSPRLTGRLGVEETLPRQWRLGTEALYVGPRLAFDNSPIPAYTIVNTTLSNSPRRGRPDLSLGLYNLFDRSYSQPLAGLSRVNQPGRTWQAQVAYSF
jgi:outer membrane receptor protein involved in Fe transport